MLRQDQLYENVFKCSLVLMTLLFRLCCDSRGVEVYESKIDAINNWPTPTSIGYVHSFHGLDIFYWQFIKGFRTIDSP